MPTPDSGTMRRIELQQLKNSELGRLGVSIARGERELNALNKRIAELQKERDTLNRRLQNQHDAYLRLSNARIY